MGLNFPSHYAYNIRSFKEGDIWWCAIGENVGVEIIIDASRLYQRIGEISKGDYRKIKNGFLDLFKNKNMP